MAMAQSSYRRSAAPLARSLTEAEARVYVGNIPRYASEEEVAEVLSVFGPVVSFKLVVDKASGCPKGYGFCEFRDTETALSAQRNQKGVALCQGQQLRVGAAVTQVHKQKVNNPIGGTGIIKENQQRDIKAAGPAKHETWQADPPQERELDVFALRQAKKLKLKHGSFLVKPRPATGGFTDSRSSTSKKRDADQISSNSTASSQLYVCAQAQGEAGHPAKKVRTTQDDGVAEASTISSTGSASARTSNRNVAPAAGAHDQVMDIRRESDGIISSSSSTASYSTCIDYIRSGPDQSTVHHKHSTVVGTVAEKSTSTDVDAKGQDNTSISASSEIVVSNGDLNELDHVQLMQDQPNAGSCPGKHRSNTAAAAATPSADDDSSMMHNLHTLLCLLQASIPAQAVQDQIYPPTLLKSSSHIYQQRQQIHRRINMVGTATNSTGQQQYYKQQLAVTAM